MRLRELAERLGGRPIEGDGEHVVEGVASLEDGGPVDLGFVRSERYAAALAASRVGAVVAPPGIDVGARPVLRSPSPNLDLARAAGLLHPAPAPPAGVHATAELAASATLAEGVSIGSRAFVGERARVGKGSVLHAGAVVYDDAVVGAECVLHAGVVVREGCHLGDRVILQPGVVIGGDGFGYEFDERGGLEKVPQLGNVVIEDDVEIGANSTVDRARLGSTRIGRGVKIDNLCMVAHNVQIGEGSALVAQTGIAGSTEIGPRCFFLAQAGTAGHLKIGEGSFIGPRGGVITDLEPGARVFGFPSQPEKRWHRTMVALNRLPELLRRMRAVEKRVDGREGPQ